MLIGTHIFLIIFSMMVINGEMLCLASRIMYLNHYLTWKKNTGTNMSCIMLILIFLNWGMVCYPTPFALMKAMRLIEPPPIKKPLWKSLIMLIIYPNFPWQSIDIINWTLAANTQYAQMPMIVHLTWHFKSPFPAHNVKWQQERDATDTVCGCSCGWLWAHSGSVLLWH